ncbi:hypothetical protein BCR44DRAFT_1187046 [Catenaria anguillulae PL171]|uniref:Uncharacterized protein n=1 Tax=Catenaria anguillulae PL171 TaxID=765915 RepID=A0A1Y2HHD7_9FUNG|nr:hypothetical protein BCR44DRAFT_1187046 [Catenaria anguillulae PL171]
MSAQLWLQTNWPTAYKLPKFPLPCHCCFAHTLFSPCFFFVLGIVATVALVFEIGQSLQRLNLIPQDLIPQDSPSEEAAVDIIDQQP